MWIFSNILVKCKNMCVHLKVRLTMNKNWKCKLNLTNIGLLYIFINYKSHKNIVEKPVKHIK